MGVVFYHTCPSGQAGIAQINTEGLLYSNRSAIYYFAILGFQHS